MSLSRVQTQLSQANQGQVVETFSSALACTTDLSALLRRANLPQTAYFDTVYCGQVKPIAAVPKMSSPPGKVTLKEVIAKKIEMMTRVREIKDSLIGPDGTSGALKELDAAILGLGEEHETNMMLGIRSRELSRAFRLKHQLAVGRVGLGGAPPSTQVRHTESGFCFATAPLGTVFLVKHLRETMTKCDQTMADLNSATPSDIGVKAAATEAILEDLTEQLEVAFLSCCMCVNTSNQSRWFLRSGSDRSPARLPLLLISSASQTLLCLGQGRVKIEQ